jgi:hypothetical protein
MKRTIIATLFALILSTGIARADDEALIAKVKTTWRAQDGETAEDIVTKAAKVAQFVPRKWEIVRNQDGNPGVLLSWAKHRTDKEGDEYSISWDVANDGTMTLGPRYAKTMELGWQAFALTLIQSEIDDEDTAANRPFLHDLSNINFVQTPQGKLGDLLRQGRCTLLDPVRVDYMLKVNDEPNDSWNVQLSVNCKIQGPEYFTREGAIVFRKYVGTDEWLPFSLFAHRVAKYRPSNWFTHSEP